MGYKQGQKIGKTSTGLAEPLPLLLKQASGRGLVVPDCAAGGGKLASRLCGQLGQLRKPD